VLLEGLSAVRVRLGSCFHQTSQKDNPMEFDPSPRRIREPSNWSLRDMVSEPYPIGLSVRVCGWGVGSAHGHEEGSPLLHYHLLLSSLDLSDANVYQPQTRAHLGTAAYFCKVGSVPV